MNEKTAEQLKTFVQKNYAEICSKTKEEQNHMMKSSFTCVFRPSKIPEHIKENMNEYELSLWSAVGCEYVSGRDVKNAVRMAYHLLNYWAMLASKEQIEK